MIYLIEKQSYTKKETIITKESEKINLYFCGIIVYFVPNFTEEIESVFKLKK